MTHHLLVERYTNQTEIPPGRFISSSFKNRTQMQQKRFKELSCVTLQRLPLIGIDRITTSTGRISISYLLLQELLPFLHFSDFHANETYATNFVFSKCIGGDASQATKSQPQN
jgi:hypothetical protein